jgi:hypothetical protein
MAADWTVWLAEMSTKNVSGMVHGCRLVRLTTSPPLVSQVLRKCSSQEVSLPYSGFHGLKQGQLYLYIYIIS